MGNTDSITYYEEHKIPPDEKLTEEYKQSTDFGASDPRDKNINSASQLSIKNKRFNLTSKGSEFSINGEGYSLFYKIVKFAIYGVTIALVPLAVILMIIYHSGDDCGPSKKVAGDGRRILEKNHIEEYLINLGSKAYSIIHPIHQNNFSFLNFFFLLK